MGDRDAPPRSEPSAWRTALTLGALGGALILGLRLIEYRWLVLEQSLAVYGGLVAVLFAGLGLWLGQRAHPAAAAATVPAEVAGGSSDHAGDATPDPLALERSGLTPRELEVLTLMASGLSTSEIATRAGVSENTIKTHSSRVYSKLGVERRTQAVRVAREQRLIP